MNSKTYQEAVVPVMDSLKEIEHYWKTNEFSIDVPSNEGEADEEEISIDVPSDEMVNEPSEEEFDYYMDYIESLD